MDERPLWVQLYWGKDQREGRFVLTKSQTTKSSSQTKTSHVLQMKFSSISDIEGLLVVVSKNDVLPNANQKKRKNKTKYVHFSHFLNDLQQNLSA